MASNAETRKTVTISQDDELRLNTAVYQAHFESHTYVRLGTHPTLNLIFVRPVSVADVPDTDITDIAYKIDHTRYTGEITCQTFLQRENYHHTTTTKYIAEWWREADLLCIDLSDMVGA